MAKTIYLLQNVTAGCLGNCPQFWREGGSGYTVNIDEAQRFTPEEAANIVRSSRGTHKWKRWKVQHVLQAAIRVVDIQTLRHLAGAPVTETIPAD